VKLVLFTLRGLKVKECVFRVMFANVGSDLIDVID